MKKVIYTAITNHYDTLKDPIIVSDGFDYICVSDNPNLKTAIWQYKPIAKIDIDKRRLSRDPKIRPHRYFQDYDVSVYVDGSLQILKPLNDLIDDELIKNVKHTHRSCIYEEAIACIQMRKDSSENINSQMMRYGKEGYPPVNGLIAGRVIIRYHNNEKIISIMEDWWNEIINGSRRDQLSFNYVMWKNGLPIKYMMEDETDLFKSYFKLYGHS